VGHGKAGHAKVLRIAVVQADLAQKQTEPHEAAETLQGQNSLGQNLAKRILGKPDGAGRNELARNQVPLSVVAPEWAARNPAAQNAAAPEWAARNLVAQNVVAQNAVVAVAVRKASNTSSLCDSNPSVSFPRASRLAYRSKIDTLRPVGNPWLGGTIPRAPPQGLPI
jgi:hypothetical protein